MLIGFWSWQAAAVGQAVSKALQLCPYVVVLDFSMPVMNGIEAAQEILRNRPNTTLHHGSSYHLERHEFPIS